VAHYVYSDDVMKGESW